jgi:hypothetical protein
MLLRYLASLRALLAWLGQLQGSKKERDVGMIRGALFMLGGAATVGCLILLTSLFGPYGMLALGVITVTVVGGVIGYAHYGSIW